MAPSSTGTSIRSFPADEIQATKQRAIRGDNGAANELANHYRALGQRREETRWLLVGANRGDCHPMTWLQANAEEAGDRTGANHWNNTLRQHHCRWSNTYGRGAVANSVEDTPLWNGQ